MRRLRGVVPAGYSGKPLVDKLGIKPGHRVHIRNAPPGYDRTLGRLPPDVRMSAQLRGSFDFIQGFYTGRARLEADAPRLLGALADGGMIWVSWPKKASGVATDITEDVVRAVCLPLGIVDVKVAAVDEVWSGLKFLRRRA